MKTTSLSCLGFRNARAIFVLGAVLGAGSHAGATTTHYVVKDNPDAEAPYTTWETAAPDIQTAIDAAPADGLVLVADGNYDTGEVVSLPDEPTCATNRIVIPDTLSVQSVNGPGSTVLSGGSGIRCATLIGSARLIGFTLTGADGPGGVWSEDGAAQVVNCWILENRASLGGGARGLTLADCILSNNTATLRGGGAYDCLLQDCRLAGNTAEHGGGAAASVLRNCLVSGNAASEAGGGVFESVLRGCLVTDNTASQGGGGADCDLYSSTVSRNRAALSGGGISGGTAFNSIMAGNVLDDDTPANWADVLLEYSCTSPLPDGTGNIDDDPLFTNPSIRDFRLLEGSPCIDAGLNQEWMGTAVDLDGNPRILNETVDMGAYEFVPSPLPEMAVLGTHGLPLEPEAEPDPAAGTAWSARTGQNASRTFVLTNSGPGTLLIHGMTLTGPDAEAFSIPGFPLAIDPGEGSPFPVLFSPVEARTHDAALEITHSADNMPSPFILNLRGEGALPADRYVSLENPSAAAPYTNWVTAAADIQSAVDISLGGDTIWVGPGDYETGTVIGPDGVLHRVAVTQSIAIRSVEGLDTTSIFGGEDIRAVYLAPGAVLDGFTVSSSENTGGILCADETSMVSGCLIMGNTAAAGGGIRGGTVLDSTLISNQADVGGGAFESRLIRCQLLVNTAELGRGAAASQLDDCYLWGNQALESGGGIFDSVAERSMFIENGVQGESGGGGGAADSSLYSCLLRDNEAAYGGGSRGGFLRNCTLVQNDASMEGGGAYEGALYNCIAWLNTQGMVEDNVSSATLSHCCVSPLLPGPGNIDADPLFVDAAGNDFRLVTNSPCIEAGESAFWMTDALDLDGNPRLVGPAADIGAYEHPFTPSGIPAAWLLDHDLLLDGSDDFADTDDDGADNWTEWKCETDPRDSLSRLALFPPVVSAPPDGIGWILQWQSVEGKTYAIQRSTNLTALSAFQPLPDAEAIVGLSDFTTHTDRTAEASAPCFYRILVP